MDIEELRGEVKKISKAVKEIRNSGITDQALVLLIQKAAPSSIPGYPEKKPTLGMIRAVMDGMEELQTFVFGEEETEMTEQQRQLEEDIIRRQTEELKALKRVAFYAEKVMNGDGPGSCLALEQSLDRWREVLCRQVNESISD